VKIVQLKEMIDALVVQGKNIRDVTVDDVLMVVFAGSDHAKGSVVRVRLDSGF
jgi:hypothetical protein